MVGKLAGERRLYLGVAALVLVTVGVVMLVRRPAPQPATNTAKNNEARQTYATLYDSLWRQDSGQGSILMTATLFVPPMITALGQDTQRSEAEEQLWNTLKNISSKQAGIYLTLDSVTGFVTDDEIQKSLSLESSGGPAWQLATWQPIIGTGSPVNANVSVTSQRGLAIFTADENIDWTKLNQVTLRATNLGDQPVRQFVWTQVGSISQ